MDMADMIDEDGVDIGFSRIAMNCTLGMDILFVQILDGEWVSSTVTFVEARVVAGVSDLTYQRIHPILEICKLYESYRW